MAWGKGRTPSYNERPVTKDDLEDDYAEWVDSDCRSRFRTFIDSISPTDKLFFYRKNETHSGTSGYYRLLADGTKVTFNIGAWMS